MAKVTHAIISNFFAAIRINEQYGLLVCTKKIMLEYVKTILLKVSFDKMLFEKELRKAFKVLLKEELQQLREWCYEKFSGMYLIILNKVFSKAQL